MSDSKKSQPASPDSLAKTSSEGSVELTEKQLADAAGGSLNFTSQALKLDTQQKWDPNTGLLLPAVKPGQ
jgi:hypothetical protein